MEKIYTLKKKLMKNQEVTEDMFAELTSKEMMELAKLLVSNYNNVCIHKIIEKAINKD